MGFRDELFTAQVDSNLKCGICLEVLDNPTTVCKQGHLFCRACIKSWLTVRRICPVDRAPVTSSSIRNMASSCPVASIVSNLPVKCPNSTSSSSSWWTLLPSSSSSPEEQVSEAAVSQQQVVPREEGEDELLPPWRDELESCLLGQQRPTTTSSSSTTTREGGGVLKAARLLIQEEEEVKRRGASSGPSLPSCRWEGCLGELSKHEEACLYSQVNCPFRSRGCNFSGIRLDLPLHENKCQFQEKVCELCGESFALKDFEHHVRECPQAEVVCKNGCWETFKRHSENHHNSTCPMQRMDCAYSEYGCTVRLRRKDLSRHYLSARRLHQRLFDKFLDSLGGALLIDDDTTIGRISTTTTSSSSSSSGRSSGGTAESSEQAIIISKKRKWDHNNHAATVVDNRGGGGGSSFMGTIIRSGLQRIHTIAAAAHSSRTMLSNSSSYTADKLRKEAEGITT